MPAHIVLVYDDPALLYELAAALREAGHDVIASDDLEMSAASPDQIITEIRIERTLGLYPGIQIAVKSPPQTERRGEGGGAYLGDPVTVPEIVAAVRRLLPRRA